MSPNRDDRLVTALAGTALELLRSRTDTDVEHALGEIVRSAVENVPGADSAGVSLETSGKIESRAPFDDSVRELDQLQAELGECPCMNALGNPQLGDVVVVEDLLGADADRWPRFAALAVKCDYRSMCSIQLSADGGTRAALNLYAHAAGAFGEYSRTVASLFGTQAAVLLYGAERATNLGIALHTRDKIGQAKGILMERYALDDGAAFQMLVRASQNANMKLHDVALWLTTDGRNTTPRRPGADEPFAEDVKGSRSRDRTTPDSR